MGRYYAFASQEDYESFIDVLSEEALDELVAESQLHLTGRCIPTPP